MASDGAAAPAAEPAAAAPVPEAATAAPAAPEESEPESMFRPIGETAESGTGAGDAEDDGLLEEDSDDELVKSKVMKDITVVPSLCVACEENGKTSIFMTHIPFFRDVIIMSFRCGECGHRSSEVQEAEMQEKGCRFTVRVETPQVCVLFCGALSSLERRRVRRSRHGWRGLRNMGETPGLSSMRSAPSGRLPPRACPRRCRI